MIAIILTWKLLYDNSPQKLIPSGTSAIKLSSSIFKEGQPIPQKYSCDGENINPPLSVSGVPAGTKSLALIIDDPDAATGDWTHWIVWNISPETKEIKENNLPKGAVLGTNDGGKLEYGGPCPPSFIHHYYFKIFALNTVLDLAQGSSRPYLEEAMKDHIIGKGSLVGTFSR